MKLKKWGFDGGSAAGCRWRASGMWRPNKSLKLAPRSLLPVDRSFITCLMCVICFFPVAAKTFWFYCVSSDRKCVKFLFSKGNKSLFSNIVMALKELLSSFEAQWKSQTFEMKHFTLFSVRHASVISTFTRIKHDGFSPSAWLKTALNSLLARLFGYSKIKLEEIWSVSRENAFNKMTTASADTGSVI